MTAKKQKTAKMPYFRDIYTQMMEDDEKTFWDTTPMNDNLIGRTVSHVIFRTIGVDIAMYLADRMESGNETAKLSDINYPPDIADYEFLSAWNNLNQSFSTLQLEALSFRAMIKSRDYQIWLAEKLSKIPITQWEKSRNKFTKQCGNPLYIAGFHIWVNTLRGKSSEDTGLYSNWLPKDIIPVEQYAISRLLRDYEVDEEVQSKIDTYTKEAKEHGYLSMQMTQGRVSKLYNATQLLGYTEFGLTDSGLEYYENASIYWRLWAESVDLVAPEGADPIRVAASLANSLVTGVNTETLGRVRASFINEWSRRNQTKLAEMEESKLEKELNKAQEEIASLKLALKTKESELISTKKDLSAAQEHCDKLEERTTHYIQQNTDLKAKLKATEKKLLKAVNDAENLTPTGGQIDNTLLLDICNKVKGLEEGLCIANEKIADLHVLLSADEGDIEEDSFNDNLILSEEDTDLYTESITDFTGRLIINGGSKPWQDRVRKWFEDQGVKVRTYGLGDDISGLRQTDTVLLNVIQNKHKYSVKLMNEVRSLGARLVVCNVNNIEHTLRLVLDPSERQSC